MAAVTRESAKLEGAINNESAELGVWQQIIDRVLATSVYGVELTSVRLAFVKHFLIVGIDGFSS